MEQNFPRDSLNYHIKNVVDNANDVNSDMFYIAISELKKFIEAKYKEAVKNAEEAAFIDTLFLQVSQKTVENTGLSMLLLAVICDADIGNKILKANRMWKEVVNIQPDTSKFTAHNIKKILIYISKILDKSIQLVLVPIRELVWTWLLQQKPNEMVAALHLLNINFKHFYQYFRNNFGLSYSAVLTCLQNSVPEVRNAAFEVVEAAIKLPDDISIENVKQYATKIVQIINSMSSNIEGIINAVEYIFNVHPKCIPMFKFDKFPVSFLRSSDTKEQIAAFRLLPIAYLTNPALFENELKNVYQVYEEALSKESTIRNVILRSFGAFLFAHRGVFSKNDEERIKKFQLLILNDMETKYGIYANIAMLTTSGANVDLVCNLVSKHQISPTIRDALYHFTVTYKESAEKINNLFIALVNKYMFSTSTNPEKLILYIKSFDMFKIPLSMLSNDVIMRYSINLQNSNYYVRKYMMNLILKYQNEIPSLPVLIRILTVVQTEGNEVRRVKTLKELRFEPISEVVIPYLKSLLYDANPKVSHEIFRPLLQYICFKEAADALDSYLNECFIQIRDFNSLSSNHISPFINSYDKLLDPEFPNKEILRNILVNYTSGLSAVLIGSKVTSTSLSIKTLKQILVIAPHVIDDEKLVALLNEALTAHSSPKKLDAVLDLLDAALSNTSLAQTIYYKDSSLIAKVHNIAKLPENEVKHEKVLKVLAHIGALSPDFVRDQTEKLINNNVISRNTPRLFINHSPSFEPKESIQYAATGVILSNIFDILGDESLEQLHTFAVDAFLLILKSNRQIDPALEKEFLKRVGNFMTSNSSASKTILLTNLSTIIALLGEKYSPLVPTTVDFICKEWESADKAALLRITEWMMINVPQTLTHYLVRLANVFTSNIRQVDNKATELIYNTFLSFGSSVSAIEHIVYPSLLDTIARTSLETEVCASLVDKLRQLISFTGAAKFSAPIIRTMVKVVHNNEALNDVCIKVVAAVAASIGDTFMLYYPMVKNSFDTEKFAKFNIIINCFSNKTKIPDTVLINVLPPAPMKKSPKSQRKSITPTIATREPLKPKTASADWDENSWYTWFDDAFAVLIKKSALRSISATATLVQRYPLLRNVLYPLAFVNEYVEQMDLPSSQLSDILDTIFESSKIPVSVLRTFISIIELFDALGIKHRISTSTLAQACLRAGDLPTAIQCYEDLLDSGKIDVAETLLDLNMKIGHTLSANGILELTRIYKIPISHEENAEKLGLWEEALDYFSKRQADDPSNAELTNGKMRCLAALMRYKEITEDANCNQELLATAYLHMHEIDKFLETNLQKGSILELCQRVIKGEDLTDDIEAIKLGRTNKLFPALTDNYRQKYPDFEVVCLMNELQEVIKYNNLKQSIPPSAKYEQTPEMKRIVDIWDTRFHFINQSPKSLLEHICVRSLAIGLKPQISHILKFINTAINDKCYSVADKIIEATMEEVDTDDLKMAKIRLLLASERNEEAFALYDKFVSKEDKNSEIYSEVEAIVSEHFYDRSMLNEAREHLKKSLEVSMIPRVWSLWEKINMALYRQTKDVQYLHESFRASLNGLMMDTQNSLGYMLSILNVFFNMGSTEIAKIFVEALNKLPTHSWLLLLPQIVALSYSSDETLRNVIHELIFSVGMVHPQPIIYALMVPKSNEDKMKAGTAMSLLDKLRTKYNVIVQNVENLTSELLKVALNWHEFTMTSIDDLSKAINDGNIDVAKSIIKQMRKEFKQNEESLNEISFITSCGDLLQQAEAHFKAYCKTNDKITLNIAVRLYAQVYGYCKRCIHEISSFPLENASLKMSSIIKKSTIVVPGTYDPGRKPIYLEGIEENIKVMSSKQRPRSIKMLGSDGVDYNFLLKAHEDTRLDERVMQLFEFVNTLVRSSEITLKQHLSITTYKVTPLTLNVGLIGWVPNCTTLFEIIKQQRAKKRIPLTAEIDAIYGNLPDFDNAPVEKKLTAFRIGLRATKGTDIRDGINSGSADSYHWIERRTNYSTSLSMTSMIGYVLGLGDRHVQNIMINTDTGKLVHIDFGDCFEVAMKREKFPEKVQFRFTRNLQNALEVSRIEGTFRKCSEDVISLVRKYNTEILGLLNAFIYDPLDQWKEPGAAEKCISRISDKLNGKDMIETGIPVNEQVDLLINEATDVTNLCQMFKGWCAFW